MYTLRLTTGLNNIHYILQLAVYEAVSKTRIALSELSSGVAVTSAIPQEDAATRVERIMNIHGNSILRYAYSYVHNNEDAEDILQETLIKFLRTNPTFENDSHAKAWLFTVAGNLAKNKIRYNTVRSHDELNEELVSEKKEDLSFIWEAVKELPEDYREVIHLFYQEDFTTAQIAEVLGRKEATVRSQLKRGREKLKKVLKEVYDFGE